MPMLDSLDAIRTALVAMTDAELAALDVAAEEVTVTPGTSGLYAAVAHACDWEHHRRRGINFALSGPHEAIDRQHVAVSYTALAVFGAAFPCDAARAGVARRDQRCVEEARPTVH